MHQWDSEPASTHQTLRELVNRVVPGDVETGIVLLERGEKIGRFCSVWRECELDFQPGLQCWAHRDRKTDPKRTTNVYQTLCGAEKLRSLPKAFATVGTHKTIRQAVCTDIRIETVSEAVTKIIEVL